MQNLQLLLRHSKSLHSGFSSQGFMSGFLYGVGNVLWSWMFMFLQIKEHDLFFKAVSLCHTVQISNVQTDGIGDGPWQSNLAPAQLEYYASSPDEKALVEAAARWLSLIFLILQEYSWNKC